MFPFLISFWLGQTQVWNVYNIWVRDHVRREIGSFTMPVPWLQAIDDLAPIVLAPLVIALWRRQARSGREPDHIIRIAIGCIIFGAGMTWLVGASAFYDAHARTPLVWAIGFHIISNIGWVFAVPTALAMFAARSPRSIRGAAMGANYLTTFIGSVLSGRLGGLYERLEPGRFWLLHAAIVTGAGVLLLVVARPIRSQVEAG
jgi:POT family proton-dependent oligopeptide transporter